MMLDEILFEVSTITGISVDDIKSRKTDREVCTARQLFCFIAKQRTRKTDKVIGVTVNRNRASVIHSKKVIENGIYSNDPTIVDYIKNM